MKNRIILRHIFVLISISSFMESHVFAADLNERSGDLTMGIGWERLHYEENEPDNKIESDVELDNLILDIAFFKEWGLVFTGIRSRIPALMGKNTEQWSLSGTLFQSNSLKFMWKRFDGYVGLPFKKLLNPYGGIHWSEVIQKRADFHGNSNALYGKTKETTRSWNLLLGIMGSSDISPHWVWNYRLEYIIPLDVKVTNDSIPGFSASDTDGFTVELNTGIFYQFDKFLCLEILIFGGRMHWEGSNWKQYNNTPTKWPVNTTDYVGGILNVKWDL